MTTTEKINTLNNAGNSLRNIATYLQNAGQEWAVLQNTITAIGQDIDNNPDTKMTVTDYNMLIDEYNMLIDIMVENTGSFVRFDKK